MDGILFAADIEKAFDSVEHNFSFSLLRKFGSGPEFIQWIKTMFCNAENCVMNNGNSIRYLSLERRTRQGYPLSPYIFILVLEIFIQIREDKIIKGFRFKTVEVKLTAYTEDTTFLVRDLASLKRLLKIMKEFEKFSTLRANVEKCEACWIGKAKENESRPIKYKWASLTKKSIKILGIFFSYDKRLVEKDNFYSLILDCRSLLNIWKQRMVVTCTKNSDFEITCGIKTRVCLYNDHNFR